MCTQNIFLPTNCIRAHLPLSLPRPPNGSLPSFLSSFWQILNHSISHPVSTCPESLASGSHETPFISHRATALATEFRSFTDKPGLLEGVKRPDFFIVGGERVPVQRDKERKKENETETEILRDIEIEERQRDWERLHRYVDTLPDEGGNNRVQDQCARRYKSQKWVGGMEDKNAKKSTSVCV